MLVNLPPQMSSTTLFARKSRHGEGGFGGFGRTSAKCHAAVKRARSLRRTRVPSVRAS